LIKYHFNKIILIIYNIWTTKIAEIFSLHSSSDWKKAALRTKKTLQNSGIAEFEAHPEYRKITDCKPDDDNYPSSEDCNRQVPRPAKRGRCPNGTRLNKRTQNCEQK